MILSSFSYDNFWGCQDRPRIVTYDMSALELYLLTYWRVQCLAAPILSCRG